MQEFPQTLLGVVPFTQLLLVSSSCGVSLAFVALLGVLEVLLEGHDLGVVDVGLLFQFGDAVSASIGFLTLLLKGLLRSRSGELTGFQLLSSLLQLLGGHQVPLGLESVVAPLESRELLVVQQHLVLVTQVTDEVHVPEEGEVRWQQPLGHGRYGGGPVVQVLGIGSLGLLGGFVSTGHGFELGLEVIIEALVQRAANGDAGGQVGNLVLDIGIGAEPGGNVTNAVLAAVQFTSHGFNLGIHGLEPLRQVGGIGPVALEHEGSRHCEDI
ncbi:hypothetical protein PG985_007897 [Apiospora marii]|uniref:Uncharacterized protein n=1 Tax=Apiospora marii TaxID=335849 RepID=A0ABR1R9U6_9PEZI